MLACMECVTQIMHEQGTSQDAIVASDAVSLIPPGNPHRLIQAVAEGFRHMAFMMTKEKMHDLILEL
jgi:hypothetical protein